jgi:aspartyl-tRNA(Asn)/glutamyl-tRNA(Gln) amidotransferase subunit A
LAEARDLLRAKSISSRELVDAHLAAIEAANDALNAFVLITPERALAMAEASDARLKNGKAGALEGIPLGIKDLFCTKDVRTTACSHILDGFTPTYESTVTANLWAEGGVMLGKLNNDEFAMGSSNETSYYGPVVNPWQRKGSNAKLVPGGSSGGSSAAVAARLCMGATATDTGGSIRQPAAVTGTVGIKPTYGRCSRWGIVAFASSLDQAGPIARSVRDAAILLKVMASHDPKDTTSVDLPVPDFEKAVERGVKGLTIGIPKEYRMPGMPAEIEALWQKGVAWLKDAGATIKEVSLPHTKYALPSYYIVAPAEASSNLARYDGVRYGLREPGSDVISMYENTRRAGFGDRHLRAIGGLLRRLLSQGAEGADFDQARLRPSLRRCRRHPDADHARSCLRARREVRGSGRDVSERHLHRHGQHGRASGHERAGGSVIGRDAARVAADRQAVRRGNLVPHGARDRGGGGASGQA